ncbi:hypothetical protein [Aeromonas hydrophila]|uniref:hypothetical protein n=1 Tax=Aeromonas hydrophila TaxID=644 RepID=UPI00080AB30F|nr:hypothetical protein [Aeromonas hydrophila]ANT66933.1 hypothetical protein TK34_05340 [Aeromonas hydrophila]
MSSQTVWLPTALYTALIRLHMDDFTAIEFVNAIFGDKADSQIRKRRYTFIYRHLIKLVNQGLLKRKKVDDGMRFSHFIRTPKFDEVHFKEEFIGPDALVTESGKEREPETYESVLEGLSARAQHYRQALQECDSMLTEYQELRSDFSILDLAIERAINHTVAESRDLRGRLEAVERLLRGLMAFRSAS